MSEVEVDGEKMPFSEWVERNRIRSLERHIDTYRAALLEIAALNEGPVVTGGFDEPGSAALAREALAAHWEGRCVHGRDPWHRCDKCERDGQVIAWAKAEIERQRGEP